MTTEACLGILLGFVLGVPLGLWSMHYVDSYVSLDAGFCVEEPEGENPVESDVGESSDDEVDEEGGVLEESNVGLPVDATSNDRSSYYWKIAADCDGWVMFDIADHRYWCEEDDLLLSEPWR